MTSAAAAQDIWPSSWLIMEGTCQIVFLILILAVTSCSGNTFGIVYGASEKNDDYFCMMFESKFHPVPSMLDEAPKRLLVDLTPATFCNPVTGRPGVAGHVLAISRGNCTFSEKAKNVQKIGGRVALIISKTKLSKPVANKISDYQEINITVALLLASDFQKLKNLGSRVMVQLYSKMNLRIDSNLLFIWVIALATVCGGSYWSGTIKNNQRVARATHSHRRQEGAPSPPPPDVGYEHQETFNVSPGFIGVFVIMMCVTLVMLYFLYDYLVYFVIVVFMFAASGALYSTLKVVMFRLPFIGSCRLPPLPYFMTQLEVRRVILGMLCLAFGLWWAAVRNSYYAWILQDILGVAFCVNMLKTIHLSSFKACTVLLVLLFFYDIFFVFVTPLLTKSGESIMVDVATGGSSTTGEMLPMVLRVPRFNSGMMSRCALPYSLLGFGDILVPGLLVSYVYAFDLKVQSGHIYFICCAIGYGLGLLMTFASLILMNVAQPALLYLVPCTIIPTFTIAIVRKEVKYIWDGELQTDRPKKPAGPPSQSPKQSNAAPPSPKAKDAPDVAPHHEMAAPPPSTPAALDEPPVPKADSMPDSKHLSTEQVFPSNTENQLLIDR